MSSYSDQLGNKIHLDTLPKRIISLVPSQSEYLWDLGLREELIGITKFCIHPEEMYQRIQRVGGTKQLDLEKIRALKPDLIIGNKEENDKDQIRILQKEFRVWMSDIYTPADALNMMGDLGRMLGKEPQAKKWVVEIDASLKRIKNYFEGQSLAYFIWSKPYLFAASNTFIHAILEHIGFKNALASYERYPELNEEELKKLNPQLCFLSSEPFPFKEKHVKEIQDLLPKTKLLLVDGEMFSWYGSRLLKLEAYLKELKKQMS